MPRLVKITANRPIMVGDVKICMCGLSKDKPFCDESHHLTDNEDESKLYYYGNGQQEIIAVEEEQDCGSDGHCGNGGCGDGGCGHCEC